MTNSLSNLVNNLTEQIHKIRCKHGLDNKTVKRVKLNTNIVSIVLNKLAWRLKRY